MVLHLCVPEKFIPPFIDFLDENFDDFEANHRFVVIGDVGKQPLEQRKNIDHIEAGKTNRLVGYAKLAYALHRADKIMLHSLSNMGIVRLLWIMPWLLSKCYWVIWGDDLYSFMLSERNWRWRVREFFRRPVMRRIGHLVTYIEGDVKLARKWYGCIGIYHECVMYPSNLYRDLRVSAETHGPTNIQIGNSARPTNNHFEILDKLLPFRDLDIAIYAPLSYGSPANAEAVIKAGMERFGDKFIPITEFLPFERYLEFLCTIDIAIFGHKRQEGMGNIITLLGLGKKVYIRKDVSSASLFDAMEVNVGDITEVNLAPLTEAQRRENQVRISQYFSEDRLREQLHAIFEG